MNLSKNFIALFCIVTGIFFIAVAAWIWRASPANAQCGTQASSCKNCHEVQGEKSVNKDGKPWHQSHAFGDFCANCHAGNVQSLVKEDAHQGMVAPLSDVQGACANCHPNDLMERANVYATLLGVEVGVAKAASTENGEAGELQATDIAAAGEKSQEAALPAMITGNDKVIDYNQRYEETVNPSAAVNWGNIIVILLILAVAVGGGGFVFWNEKYLRQQIAPIAQNKEVASAKESVIHIDGVPMEVAALLPQLSKMTPIGLRALHRLLEHPEEASELLYSLSQIDAELLRRVQNLDDRARALLIALTSR